MARGSWTMGALLLCAAAVLVTSVPASPHAESDDGKKLTPPPSFNPEQQLAVIPEPGWNECGQSFSNLSSCAADIWNTITGKQTHLVKTCCQVFGEFQEECIYKAFRALNVNVLGLDVWIQFLKSGCTEVGFLPLDLHPPQLKGTGN